MHLCSRKLLVTYISIRNHGMPEEVDICSVHDYFLTFHTFKNNIFAFHQGKDLFLDKNV